jgi:prophage regulatory protein
MKPMQVQLPSKFNSASKNLGFDNLPDTAYVREAELVRTQLNPSGLLPFSSHTLWRKVREGSFPHPLKLASRVTVWRVSDIRTWMEAISK